MIVDFYSNIYQLIVITITILSYTVLDDDISYEKLSSKLEEAEVQGLIM